MSKRMRFSSSKFVVLVGVESVEKETMRQVQVKGSEKGCEAFCLACISDAVCDGPTGLGKRCNESGGR